MRHPRARVRRPVGAFRVDIEICRPGRQPRWASVRQVLVDSGSEMTWLPERLLRSIGIDVFKRDQHFVMANGLEITRDVGIAVIRSGDFARSPCQARSNGDRKSTRLNSSHGYISYAVFCLKKKKNQ